MDAMVMHEALWPPGCFNLQAQHIWVQVGEGMQKTSRTSNPIHFSRKEPQTWRPAWACDTCPVTVEFPSHHAT